VRGRTAVETASLSVLFRSVGRRPGRRCGGVPQPATAPPWPV